MKDHSSSEAVCESSAVADTQRPAIAYLVRDSLQRCGLLPEDMELETISSSHDGVSMLVHLRTTHPMVWQFAGHLQSYVTDRVQRHTGIRIRRLLFTPLRQVPDAANSLTGVRVVHASLQTERSAVTNELNITHPRILGHRLARTFALR